jgi:GH43 family beta-xylosidase
MRSLLNPAALALCLAACAGAGTGPQTPSTGAASTFTNPIITSRDAADPWVIRHGDQYYFTATLEPEGGIWVWRSPTLTGLDQGEKVRVWTAPESGPLSSQIWAPELYRLQGGWFLYFTASDGEDRNHRHYVLEARTDDPLGPYHPPTLVHPDFDQYAIDGSVLEMPDGRLYFMFAAGGLYIAPMSDPRRVSGPAVKFSDGTHDWERGWQQRDGQWVRAAGYWIEAPQALVRNGRVFVIYSAGHSATPHYYLGLLELQGDDPMDVQAWVKRPEPVFAPFESGYGNVYTPGHNSFTTSPDGREDWIVYHAKDVTTGGFRGRTTRAQPFGWNLDGTPAFGTPVPSGVPIRRPSGETGNSR